MSASFGTLRYHSIQTSGFHGPSVFGGCDHRNHLDGMPMARLDHFRARIAQAHAEDRHALF
jgi:hypothetical protein